MSNRTPPRRPGVRRIAINGRFLDEVQTRLDDGRSDSVSYKLLPAEHHDVLEDQDGVTLRIPAMTALQLFEQAENLFVRLLWLSPSDNLGVRFLLQQVRAGLDPCGAAANPDGQWPAHHCGAGAPPANATAACATLRESTRPVSVGFTDPTVTKSD
jgi:hypothetical protein